MRLGIVFLRLNQLLKNNFQESSDLKITVKKYMRTWLTFIQGINQLINVILVDRKGANLTINLTISFREAAEGVRKELLVEKLVKCGVCNGTRSHDSVPPTRCWTCYGKGVTITKNGPYIEEDVCFKCKGSGVTIKKKCGNCKGEGLIKQHTYEKIRIPSTDEDKFTLEFDHKGHQSVNSIAGKLIVNVEVTPHEIFTRKKLDVYSNVGVPYHIAVLGGEILIDTINGKESITIPPAISHNDTKKLSNKGFTCSHSGVNGDHYVSLYLKAPDSLCTEEIDLYKLLTSTG